jgi:hypothetical protein
MVKHKKGDKVKEEYSKEYNTLNSDISSTTSMQLPPGMPEETKKKLEELKETRPVPE